MYFNFPHDLCTVSHLRIQVLYITLIHQSISHSLGVKQVYFIDGKKLKVLFYIKKNTSMPHSPLEFFKTYCIKF